ncbi:hypothetical protein Tco_0862899 [Tanacetum coccineum]
MSSFILQKAPSASVVTIWSFYMCNSEVLWRMGVTFQHPLIELSVPPLPLRLCTSLSVDGGSRSVIALTFEGLSLIPCLVIRCPRNGLSSTPKEHFFGLSFISMDQSLSKVYGCISTCFPIERHLMAFMKHLSWNPERDSTFQSIFDKGAQSSLLLLDRLDMLVFVCDISIDTTMPIFCIAVLPSRELLQEAKNVR